VLLVFSGELVGVYRVCGVCVLLVFSGELLGVYRVCGVCVLLVFLGELLGVYQVCGVCLPLAFSGERRVFTRCAEFVCRSPFWATGYFRRMRNSPADHLYWVSGNQSH